MKATTTFVLLLCFSVFVSAQVNLVLNPSLESYITCPGFGQFNNSFINDWDKPTYGSTDYYNYTCPGILPTQQVPRTGDGYAGIICYNYGTEYREYMTGTLTSPLVPGATYYCEFYVSLNDGYIQAIKEVGAYFSASPPGPYPNALHVPATPQILNTTLLLDDTAAWMKVSGYFLAAGGEQYICIGNFYNDTNTTIVQVGSVGSYGTYYFVDDVWVSLSEGMGLSSVEDGGMFIYPNPVREELGVRSLPTGQAGSEFGAAAVDISIYNMIGEKVLAVPLRTTNSEPRTIDVSALNPGIYFAEVKSGEKIYRKKIVKE